MKNKIIASILTLLILHATHAQEVWKGDTNSLNQEFLLKTIPGFDVRDKAGNMFKLNDFIMQNRLHDDKPILIVLWGVNGSYALGVDKLKAMDSAKLGNRYNVIALCVSHEKDKSKQPQNMQELLKKFDVKNKWGKFILAVTDFEGVANFYLNSFPNYIYADSKMNIIYISEEASQPSYEENVLQLINKGLMKKGEFWYSKKGEMVAQSDAAAYYYTKCKIAGNRINLVKGTKNLVLVNYNYLKVGNEYLFDGVGIGTYESGEQRQSGEFKQGIPTSTFKEWYKDGQLSLNIPVNGTLKSFNEKGEIMQEGPMKNGLGEGLFTEYNNGKKKIQKIYVSGNQLGLETEYYNDGSIVSERFASPFFDAHPLNPKLIKGLQCVIIKGKFGFVNREGKIIIPAIYEYADDFKDGLAHVKQAGENFYIYNNGQRAREKYIEE